MATRIIGIDLGTSTTVVRVHNVGAGNRIVPVTINGQRTIPTIGFQPKDSDEIYYGYDALAQSDMNVEGTLYENFKMDLISENENKRNQAEVLIEGFMGYIYNQYQIQLNNNDFDPADEVKVYVSHPAKWNSYARNLMKQCVARAGFCNQENIALKDEPTAAILAVIHEKSHELSEEGMLFEGRKYRAMIIDMGAGTTDIVLCTYQVANGRFELDDIFTYPSINAPGLCGGREIDKAIFSEAERFIKKMQERTSAAGMKTLYRFSRNVKHYKDNTVSEALLENKITKEPEEIEDFRLQLSEYGIPVMNENEKFCFDRKQFENLTKVHWKQWTKLINGAFNEVKGQQFKNMNCPKQPEDVELLIITGGHSQWYIVPEYLLGEKTFIDLPVIDFTQIKGKPNRLVQSEDPQETVAVGLCHLDEDVVGTIAASNDVAISFKSDKYLGACELIKKGTPLPYENKDIIINNTITGNFIFRKAIEIEYSVITDKKNTIVKKQTIPSTGLIEAFLSAIFSAMGVAILDIPRIIWLVITGNLDRLDESFIAEIINHDYEVKLSPHITVNDEGIIEISGSMAIGSEEVEIPKIVI